MFSAPCLQFFSTSREPSIHGLSIFLSVVLLRLSWYKHSSYILWGLLPTPSPLNSPVKTPTLCLSWTHALEAKCGWRNDCADFTCVRTNLSLSILAHSICEFICLLFKMPLHTSLSKGHHSFLHCVEGFTSYFLEANGAIGWRAPICAPGGEPASLQGKLRVPPGCRGSCVTSDVCPLRSSQIGPGPLLGCARPSCCRALPPAVSPSLALSSRNSHGSFWSTGLLPCHILNRLFLTTLSKIMFPLRPSLSISLVSS